jgi:hypothetical protein
VDFADQVLDADASPGSDDVGLITRRPVIMTELASAAVRPVTWLAGPGSISASTTLPSCRPPDSQPLGSLRGYTSGDVETV